NGVGIVAERPTYFIHDFGNGSINGAHDVLGAAVGDTSWFFAEGTLRNGFFEFITIQNPTDAPAHARLDYFINGAPIETNVRDVPANSRATVVAFDRNSPGSLAEKLLPSTAIPADLDFGLRVTSVGANNLPDSSMPIVVERPMYVNSPIAGSSVAINDGHDTLGFQFPAGEVPLLPGQPPANLAITKAALNPTAFLGELITFTIAVANNGPGDATDVVVNDAVPAGTNFVSAPGCVNDSGTLVCQAGTIVNGANAGFTVVLSPTVAGTVTNTASVSSATQDDNPGNNSATAVVTVTPPEVPSEQLMLCQITKTESPGPHYPGDEVTYTLTVTN